MDDKAPKVKSLYKALKLLDLFDNTAPERGINELAEATGMLKSSVYNIMSTFRQCGFIEKTGSGKYSLGRKILELGNVLLNNDTTRQVVKPYMDRLAEECNEVVYLARPSGTRIVYMDSSYPKTAMAIRVILGISAPYYCTGIGKAMLAFLGDDLTQQVISEGFTQYTPFTLTNGPALLNEMEEIRKRGYSIDNMEHEYGIRCVGVPIFNYQGDVVAGLSISGPSLRVMDDKVTFLAKKLLEAAQELKPQLK